MKLGSRMENAYAACHRSIKHAQEVIIPVSTSLKTLLLQETKGKSNTSTPSIVNNQKTSLPALACSSVEDDGRTGPRIAVIGYKGIDGNIRGKSTASDFAKAKGCLTEPVCFHAMLILVGNDKTGVLAHCLASQVTKATLRIAENTSTNRQPRYIHLDVSGTSE
jgi:hypothetical protein